MATKHSTTTTGAILDRPAKTPGFTHNQIESAFAEIADSARIARTLCSEAIAAPCEDRDCAGDLMAAARIMLDRIGWIADRHGHCRIKGGAEDWMLPPVYHQKSEPSDRA